MTRNRHVMMRSALKNLRIIYDRHNKVGKREGGKKLAQEVGHVSINNQ